MGLLLTMFLGGQWIDRLAAIVHESIQDGLSFRFRLCDRSSLHSSYLPSNNTSVSNDNNETITAAEILADEEQKKKY